jgi:hypothetical protein
MQYARAASPVRESAPSSCISPKTRSPGLQCVFVRSHVLLRKASPLPNKTRSLLLLLTSQLSRYPSLPADTLSGARRAAPPCSGGKYGCYHPTSSMSRGNFENHPFGYRPMRVNCFLPCAPSRAPEFSSILASAQAFAKVLVKFSLAHSLQRARTSSGHSV